MTTFNYHLIFSSRGCQEGKKFKVPLDKYDDDGKCFLTVKEEKEFSFLPKNCCSINSVNFQLIANRETIKLIKRWEIVKKYILDELKNLKLN